MTIYRVPVIQTITFIQCIQPRCVSSTALVDALEGVFERIFLDAMVGEKGTAQQQQQPYPEISEIFYGEYGEYDDPDYHYERMEEDDDRDVDQYPDVDHHHHHERDDDQHPNVEDVVRYDEIPDGW